MQLQIGKKRRFLEEAFDARTAELRVLSERKYYSMALSPHQISPGSSPNSQTHLLGSSDAKRMGLPLLQTRHGMKCLVILLEEILVIGVIILRLNIAGTSRNYGNMFIARTHRRCTLPSGGSRMVDGVSLFLLHLRCFEY
jgi:hypothetical protein